MPVRNKPTKPRGTSAVTDRRRGGTKVGWIGLVVLFGAAVVLYVMDVSRPANPSNQSNQNLIINDQNQVNQPANIGSTDSVTPLLPEPKINIGNVTPSKTNADLPQTQADCQSAAGDWTWSNGVCLPADQTTCESADGLWGPIGQSIPKGCSLLADDRDRECQDSSECAGYCLLSDAAGQNSSSRDDELANVTGRCSNRTLLKGCYVEVTRGLAGVKCL